MRLKVQHTTQFSYTAPVYETQTEIRLRPAQSAEIEQRLLDFHIRIDPPAPLFQYTDYFGNRVAHFGVLKEHQDLTIVSTSIVSTGPGRCDPCAVDEVRTLDFLSESKFVRFDTVLRDFAAAQEPSSAEPAASAASDLCRRIHESFTYETGATDVHSTSSQVIAMKRGVCQDFAHVLTAACRVRGIPARYVSGYLYDSGATGLGDGASHAWCEVYDGPGSGWVGLDPTHDPIEVDERYVKIGVGRDYADVPPVRGTYKGSAKESLKVLVDVREA